MSKILRFGLMCDGTTLQNWQVRCINNLLTLENVKLALIIINDKKKNLFMKIIRNLNSKLFFKLYMKCFSRPEAVRFMDMKNESLMNEARRAKKLPSIAWAIVLTFLIMDFGAFFGQIPFEIISFFSFANTSIQNENLIINL